jgi:hypothetical protein
VKLFTSHFRASAPPVLVREGFSWSAFLFGFLYLAAHRAFLAAALNLAALLLVLALGRALGSGAPVLGLAVLQGLFGADLRRWSLAQRGFAPGPVVAGAGRDQAFARLIGEGNDALPRDFNPRLAGAAL